MGGGACTTTDDVFVIPHTGAVGWRGLLENKKALGLAVFASTGKTVFDSFFPNGPRLTLSPLQPAGGLLYGVRISPWVSDQSTWMLIERTTVQSRCFRTRSVSNDVFGYGIVNLIGKSMTVQVMAKFEQHYINTVSIQLCFNRVLRG